MAVRRVRLVTDRGPDDLGQRTFSLAQLAEQVHVAAQAHEREHERVEHRLRPGRGGEEQREPEIRTSANKAFARRRFIVSLALRRRRPSLGPTGPACGCADGRRGCGCATTRRTSRRYRFGATRPAGLMRLLTGGTVRPDAGAQHRATRRGRTAQRSFDGKGTFNVISEYVELEGDIRYMSNDTKEIIQKELRSWLQVSKRSSE